MSGGQKLLLAVAVQCLLLAGVLGFKQYTVWTGETVVLAVEPRDPRDPFRGDYATVRYAISRLNPAQLAGDEYADGTVYVELEKGDHGFWRAVAIHDERERSFDGTVLIKGKVERSFSEDPRDGGFVYVVEYGIEEIFIPEGSGRDVPVGDDRLGVEVKVDRWGNAVARGFLLDGEPLALD